jgi:alpha-D-xyloside xylohydrolase
LPYLYSTAWQVTSDGATFMQSLPLAFGTDAKCADVKDEYMFGNSFLVAPVLKDQATSRTVYLPAGQQWYDFWTGSKTEGGATLTKTAPLNIMPLYVPAGTIMPWGPDVQYSTEKQWDNLEVRIYTGKNGQFTLYEDENDNYNYEKGNHSEIPFTWDDSSRTLTIGQRSGSFDGMLQKRTFNIVLVTDKNGFGDEHATKFDATLNYNGDATTIDFSNTAVNNVMESSITKNAIYTLDGIKMANSALSHLPKGFYISNGKKTFIK